MKKYDTYYYLAIIIQLIAVLSIFFPYDSLHGISLGLFHLETNDYAKLGDFIGGITTPILSFASFLLLIQTYNSQKEQFIKTMNLNEQQKFETTFYNSIILLNAVKNAISISYSAINKSTIEKRGSDAIDNVCDQISEIYYIKANLHPFDDTETKIENLKKSIDEYFNKYEYAFEQFYENVVLIIEILIANKLTINDFQNIKPDHYTNTLKSQLSDMDIAIIKHMSIRKKIEYNEKKNSYSYIFSRNNKEIDILDILKLKLHLNH